MPFAPSTSARFEQYATRAIFLIAGLAMATWAPLVPFAKTRLGADDASFGLLLLCLGVGSLIAMPFTGALVNRLGCRKVIVTSTLAVVAVLPLLALANSFGQLALVLALFGASIGILDVAINIQAVIVEKASGRTMMSGFHGLFSLGGILGAGGVSLLIGAGLSPLAACLCICATVVVLLVLATPGLQKQGLQSGADAPLFVLPRGIVVFLGLLCFLVFLGEGAILDWGALFLISSQGADQAFAGLGYAMFAIAMTVGRLSGDRILRRFGNKRVVLAGGILSATGFLIAVMAPVLWLALAGFLLVGLGASNIVPVIFSAAGRQTRMPAGLAIASVTTMGYAGVLVGPAIIGLIAQYAGLKLAFTLLALAYLFVGLAGSRRSAH